MAQHLAWAPSLAGQDHAQNVSDGRPIHGQSWPLPEPWPARRARCRAFTRLLDLEPTRTAAGRFCTTMVWYIACMELQAAIERISDLLDAGELETSNTSMRIPTALRDAAALAVKELGIAPSATALTTAALRTTLEAVIMQAALDDHYERYPQARPDPGDLAIAAAELDGHPLADQPGRLRQAAAEIAGNHPDASPDDVLLWPEARALPAA